MPILHCNFQAKISDAKGNEHSLQPAEALARKGPVVPVTLSLLKQHQHVLTEKGETIPRAISGFALLDTGASRTCVDKETAEKVGMAIVGTGSMSSATHENHTVPVFAGLIEIAGLDCHINMLQGMGARLATQGIIALIGRDVLARTIFTYNGSAGTISLAI